MNHTTLKLRMTCTIKTIQKLSLLSLLTIILNFYAPTANAMITDSKTGKITQLDEKTEKELFSFLDLDTHWNRGAEDDKNEAAVLKIITAHPNLDPNYKFSNKRVNLKMDTSLLDLTIFYRFVNVVNELIKRGADAKNADFIVLGMPLHNTTEELWQTYVEKAKKIIDLLVSKGADLNKKDNYGTTILDYATQFGENELHEYVTNKIKKVNVK